MRREQGELEDRVTSLLEAELKSLLLRVGEARGPGAGEAVQREVRRRAWVPTESHGSPCLPSCFSPSPSSQQAQGFYPPTGQDGQHTCPLGAAFPSPYSLGGAVLWRWGGRGCKHYLCVCWAPDGVCPVPRGPGGRERGSWLLVRKRVQVPQPRPCRGLGSPSAGGGANPTSVPPPPRPHNLLP